MCMLVMQRESDLSVLNADRNMLFMTTLLNGFGDIWIVASF